MKRRKQTRRRRGAVAVEMALTAPLLFLLLFGALELSHANMVFNVAEAAAYEGAREGIVPGATAADCRAAAQRVLDVSKVRGAQIRITPDDMSVNSDSVRVLITVPYAQNTVVTPTFTKQLTIQRQCVLTRESF